MEAFYHDPDLDENNFTKVKLSKSLNLNDVCSEYGTEIEVDFNKENDEKSRVNPFFDETLLGCLAIGGNLTSIKENPGKFFVFVN